MIKKYEVFLNISRKKNQQLKSINESIYDTKDWIEDVISTCRDIMIEINDLLGNLEVSKELSIVNSEITINCTFSIMYSGGEYWRSIRNKSKLILSHVEPRLIDYMESEGFTYDIYPLQTLDGRSLNYMASFKKPLDSEFVGHLRYLKKYNMVYLVN